MSRWRVGAIFSGALVAGVLISTGARAEALRYPVAWPTVPAIARAMLAVVSITTPGETIVIEATRLIPEFLQTTTGARVDFMNRAGRNVHIEFGGDGREHEVVQVPATGPIWAIFHRPGTHPYVVRVYDGRAVRALGGVVGVVEDDTHKWDSRTCGLIVMEICIDP